jgi:autotransporter-associated beta strand protein
VDTRQRLGTHRHRRPATPRRLHGLRLEALELRLALAADTDAAAAIPVDSYVPGHVLIKVRQQPAILASPLSGLEGSGFTASAMALGTPIPASVTSVLAGHGAGGLAKVFPTASLFVAMNAAATEGDAPKATEADLARWFSCTVDASTDIDTLLAALRADGGVEAAEPDYLFRMTGGDLGSLTGGTAVSAADGSTIPSAVTDPGYASQWHLGAVKAPEAWAYLESQGLPAGGSSSIVVAVIDTGVDYTHPDLAANMWVNAREIAGNGLDDDGNGFVDDVHGVAVVSGSHSGNPQDDNGHGTHVAGIIAASANNGIGGVGVAYNSRIMGIKAFQYSGIGSSTDIAEAIYYAVENGADIINMSFGSYSESGLVKDALQVAFGTCVLVAAAGNDGRGNLSCPPAENPANMYPAAYNWVLGVMASTPSPSALTGWRASFSNKDCLPNDAHEYELLAPGAVVYSTLPGNAYSSWSGTSMATPVASGIAALVRTKFASKDLYPSRFIMGQLAVGRGGVVDAFRNLTETPRPNLTYLNHWLFDTTAQEPGNDNDGRVDAGETVDLAIEIRNHWGKADNIVVKLEAIAQGSVAPDPYVTILKDVVNYGAVGTFNQDDNGLIYAGGLVAGVTSPFRFRVDANTPNDHVIPFRLTITANNGFDSTDASTYSFVSRFSMSVQRGRVLPSVITSDLTLTKDDFWIVGGPVLISAGATVRVNPGTQMQWGTTESSGPYGLSRQPYIKVEGTLLVEGSSSEPVRLFPSESFRDSTGSRANVRIFNTHGIARLSFTDVTAPEFGGTAYEQERLLSGYRGNHAYWLTSISDSVLRGADGAQHRTLYWDSASQSYQVGGEGYTFAAESITATRISVRGLQTDYFISWDYYSRFSEVLFEDLSGRYDGGFGTGLRHATDTVFLGSNWSRRQDAGSVLWFRGNNPTTSTSLEEAAAAVEFRNNAILNSLWNTDITKWLRLYVAAPRNSYVGLTSNFWGTSNENMLDALIEDQVDDFNKGRALTSPALDQPKETTYPFAWNVEVSGGSTGTLNQLGVELATFIVRFNRDMEISSQPQVSFGASFPYNDYTVSGDWVDGRTWQGTYNVTPLTGDGYQLIRVAGARAADKPWLVTGNDAGRFRFEIVTSGTEAMNLQASGGEGKVDLMWSQDDFELLAGYSIYRSTSATGTYERVSSTVIPKEQLSFTDRTVQPAKTYFYKFRVVKTDGTESVDSNVASGAALDTIPPQITHTPITSSAPAVAVTIRADVTDNLAVTGVTLYSRVLGTSTFSSRPMTLTTANRYSATIDAGSVVAPGVEYYLAATDGVSTVYSGLAVQPYLIRVVDAPLVTSITPATGPASGGTSVTIVGTNFKAGASVTIGGGVASNVIVVSSTQITATTPAGVPADANVTVTNPGGSQHSLVGGFRYLAAGVTASLPTVTGDTGRSLEIPVSLANAVGLQSALFAVTFDPTVLRIVSARGGALASGWSIATNTSVAGRATLSMAGSSTVSATGALAYLTFEVIGAPQTSSTLAFASMSLNDGAITTQTVDGLLTVKELYSVAGTIKYYADNTSLAGVALLLDGEMMAETNSGSTGQYSLANLRRGDYTITPAKTDDVRQITAYDASLVLQAAVGLTTLSSSQAIAADANGVNGVTALDAAYILQKSVGLIPGMLPANRYWAFTPASLTFADLNSDRTAQDFTGILIGDVSGNWGLVTGSGLGTGSGYTFSGQSAPSVLTLGTATAPSTGGKVRVPLTIERNSNPVAAADLVITYDAAQVSVTAADVTVGSAGSGMAVAVNAGTPGTLRIGMAGSQSVGSDGTLLTIDFTVRSGVTSDTAVAISSASLNEGGTRVTTVDGLLVVDTSIGVESGQTATDDTIRTGAFQLVKRGAGTLLLDKANSHSGGNIIEAGEVVVKNVAALGTGTLDVRAGAKVTLDVAGGSVAVGNLMLAEGSQLDFGFGQITVPSGGYSLAAIKGLLSQGYASSWTGSIGFTSRAVGSLEGGSVGYVVNRDGSISVGFAASGDTNLDGQVDILDISNFVSSNKYNSTMVGTWAEGDFNYDGTIDILDIAAMLSPRLYDAGSYMPSPVAQAESSSASLSAIDSAFLAWAAGTTTDGAAPPKKVRLVKA